MYLSLFLVCVILQCVFSILSCPTKDDYLLYRTHLKIYRDKTNGPFRIEDCNVSSLISFTCFEDDLFSLDIQIDDIANVFIQQTTAGDLIDVYLNHKLTYACIYERDDQLGHILSIVIDGRRFQIAQGTDTTCERVS